MRLDTKEYRSADASGCRRDATCQNTGKTFFRLISLCAQARNGQILLAVL